MGPYEKAIGELRSDEPIGNAPFSVNIFKNPFNFSWQLEIQKYVAYSCGVLGVRSSFYFEGGFGGLGVQIGIYEIENEMSFSVNVLCILLLSRLKCFLVI